MNLYGLGVEEAKRLRHHWMGPEHTLLGILRGEPGDVARRALEMAGIDAAKVEGWITRMTRDSRQDEEESGISPNPRWYTMAGRAEGFAAGLGATTVLPVHFVFALLWDRRRWFLTEEPGLSREAIVEALVSLAVEVPPAPLPELERKLNMTQYIEFPRRATDSVLRLLVERHPPGSGPAFGFNYKDEHTAWVRAEDGVDLQGILDEALGGEDCAPEP